MGRAPGLLGSVQPNGTGDVTTGRTDFWWDQFLGTTGNCWRNNTGPDGTPLSVTSTPPAPLLPSNCGLSIGTVGPQQEPELLNCLADIEFDTVDVPVVHHAVASRRPTAPPHAERVAALACCGALLAGCGDRRRRRPGAADARAGAGGRDGPRRRAARDWEHGDDAPAPRHRARSCARSPAARSARRRRSGTAACSTTSAPTSVLDSWCAQLVRARLQALQALRARRGVRRPRATEPEHLARVEPAGPEDGSNAPCSRWIGRLAWRRGQTGAKGTSRCRRSPRRARASTTTGRWPSGARTSTGTRATSSHFKQDADATPLLKGLPDDKCQCSHWGYVISGRIMFGVDGREEVIEAGEAYYIPPGHTQRAEAGTEIVQFSPSEALDQVSAQMMANMKAMMQGAERPRGRRAGGVAAPSRAAPRPARAAPCRRRRHLRAGR